MKVFICYRRKDSQLFADRIYDWLEREFEPHNVFKDIDTIPLGQDFRRILQDAVARCDALLVVIGPHWLGETDAAGRRRVDDPEDWVRIEIETALERDIPVIPLLVEGASFPREDDLPPSLQKLVYRHGTLVRPDPDFRHDIGRVIKALRDVPASWHPERSAPVSETTIPSVVKEATLPHFRENEKRSQPSQPQPSELPQDVKLAQGRGIASKRPARQVKKPTSSSGSTRGEVSTALEDLGPTPLGSQGLRELEGEETHPEKGKASARKIEQPDADLPAERSRRKQDRMRAKMGGESTHAFEDFSRRPTVFIGSSKEGQDIAKAIRDNMDEYCEAAVCGLSEGNLETLVRSKDDFDFAILVLTPGDLSTPNDLSISRGEPSNCPRDNVMLELGLFVGRLGQERTFAIYDRTAPMKLPSYLGGVSELPYILHSTGDLQSALDAPCSHLRRAMREECGRRLQKASVGHG